MNLPIKIFTDTSVLPIDNPLILQKNTQVLSFSNYGVWEYLAEIHTSMPVVFGKTSNKIEQMKSPNITITCMDYTDETELTPSVRCHDIVKQLLASLRIQ